MKVLGCQDRSRKDQVQFVLVEPGFLYMDIRAYLHSPLRQEIALQNYEFTFENTFGIGHVRP